MRFSICFLSLYLFITNTMAQSPPKNWHLLDLKTDGVRGIGIEKAYTTLLKGKAPKEKVIVAVIDVGMDIAHPSTKANIWRNRKEIPDNGIDDDRNGYIDDVNGWNFMGDCKADTYDCVREFVRGRPLYEKSADTLNAKVRYWREMKRQTENMVARNKGIVDRTSMAVSKLTRLNSYWAARLGRDSVYLHEITGLDLDPKAPEELLEVQQKILPGIMKHDTVYRNRLTLTAVCNAYQNVINRYKGEYETAKAIIDAGDVDLFRYPNHSRSNDRQRKNSVGNGKFTPIIPHGNGVAGIIAGSRYSPDTKGIASSVLIMPLQVVAPQVIGEERDEDVANAIRYAVDNGARIINFSLGKQTSPQKELVDQAVRYAEKKGVLIFAAAGNDAADNDKQTDYLSPIYLDGTRAKNLFKVGASTYGAEIIWPSSNFGKNTVDFFAPGDEVYAPALNGGFSTDSGTSYAVPNVAGVAALIWSHYPDLDYLQVKKCIEDSVVPIGAFVLEPGSGKNVPFRELSRLGGVLDGFLALKIASTIR